jgi:hypothetical protein
VQVFTFDCTYDGHNIHPKHRYIKKCLGTQDRMQVSLIYRALMAQQRMPGQEALYLSAATPMMKMAHL